MPREVDEVDRVRAAAQFAGALAVELGAIDAIVERLSRERDDARRAAEDNAADLLAVRRDSTEAARLLRQHLDHAELERDAAVHKQVELAQQLEAATKAQEGTAQVRSSFESMRRTMAERLRLPVDTATWPEIIARVG